MMGFLEPGPTYLVLGRGELFYAGALMTLYNISHIGKTQPQLT